MTRPGFTSAPQVDASSPEVRANCRNCVDHECGLYFAECACCAAWAARPGDFTFGAASLSMPRQAPSGVEPQP